MEAAKRGRKAPEFGLSAKTRRKVGAKIRQGIGPNHFIPLLRPWRLRVFALSSGRSVQVAPPLRRRRSMAFSRGIAGAAPDRVTERAAAAFAKRAELTTLPANFRSPAAN